jgi:hypothetical protein
MKIKTIKQVKAEHPDRIRLINAVLKNLDKSNIPDIINHGIAGGFGNFIYNSDTHEFAMKYRQAIIEMLLEDSNSMGEYVIDMVAGFGVFEGMGMGADDERDLMDYLIGRKCEQSTITNVLAWYAAETVCRFFEGD